MKYGKKHFSIDENRRDTYQHFYPLASCREPFVLWNTDGNMKELTAVCTKSFRYYFSIFYVSLAVKEYRILGSV